MRSPPPTSDPVVSRTSRVAAAERPIAASDRRPVGTTGRSDTTPRSSASPAGNRHVLQPRARGRRQLGEPPSGANEIARRQHARPRARGPAVRRRDVACASGHRTGPDPRAARPPGSRRRARRAGRSARSGWWPAPSTRTRPHRSASTAADARSAASGQRFCSTRTPASSRMRGRTSNRGAQRPLGAFEVVGLRQAHAFGHQLIAGA